MTEKEQYPIDILVGLAERTIKKLWVIIILLLILLFGSNAAWIYYESQFAEEIQTVTQTVDTGEGNAVVAGIGDAYGEGDADRNNQDSRP